MSIVHRAVRRLVFVIGMLAVMAQGGGAIAQPKVPAVPDEHTRASALLDELRSSLREAEAALERGPGAILKPDDAVLHTLRMTLQRGEEFAGKAEEQLGATVREMSAGRVDAGRVSARLAYNGLGAIEHSWKVVLAIAGARIAAIQAEHNTRHRSMIAQYDDKYGDIERRHSADEPALRAAEAELNGSYRALEAQEHARVRGEYDELATWILERRRTLCRSNWRLADFQSKRGDQKAAQASRAGVYASFQCDLAARGKSFHEELFGHWSGRDSELDHFTILPGAPAYLTLRNRWVDPPPSRPEMLSRLRSEPVESLREHESPAPVTVDGVSLEGTARALSSRLLSYFEAVERHDRLFARLGELAARLRARRAVPELAETRGRVQAVIEAWRQHEIATERHTAALAADRRTRNDLADAEDEIALERDHLRIRKGTTRLAGPSDVSTELLIDRESKLEADIARYTAMLQDATLPAEQASRIRDVVLPDLRAQQSALTNAANVALAPLVAKRDAARAAADRAAQTLAAIPAPESRDALRARWEALRGPVVLASEWAAKALGTDAIVFPPEPVGEPAFRVDDGLAGIERKYLQLGRSDRGMALYLLSELAQADHDVRAYAYSVAQLRSAGAILAEQAASELSRDPDDPSLKIISNLKEQTSQAKELMEEFSTQIERVDGWLQGDTPKEAEVAAIATLRDRIGLTAETLDHIGGFAETALALQEIHDDLGSDKTALKGIAGIVRLGAKAGGAVPVLGQTIGRFLEFYATAAAAAAEAGQRIQAQSTALDLAVSFSKPPPERHLYIESELGDLRIGNAEERARVLKGLQLRRLLALIAADTPQEARDTPKVGS